MSIRDRFECATPYALEVYVFLCVALIAWTSYTFYKRKCFFEPGAFRDAGGEVGGYIAVITMGCLLSFILAIAWPGVLAISAFVGVAWGFYYLRERFNKI